MWCQSTIIKGPDPLALFLRAAQATTKPLPHTPTPEERLQQTAEFWVQALHDLAQPVQALALFAERLRRLDLGPQAEPVVEHLGAGVQDVQRMLQSLMQVAQRDADDQVARALEQSQAVPVNSGPAHVPGHAARQAPPGGEGQPPELL